MAELTKLKYKRGNLKAKLTNFTNFLETTDPINDYDEIDTRVKKLDNITKDFDDIHIEILMLEDKPEHYDYKEEFDDFYYSIISKAQKMLKDHAPVRTNALNNTVIESSNSENIISNVRLPKIDLPLFNGAYDTWMCFYDTFKSMIHDKQNVSKIEKLHYLRSCLQGEASTVIQSLESTENNYEIAWSLLTERYDNKYAIINKHLGDLLLQNGSIRESATNLRQILDSINTHTRALTTLGESVDTWDTILIFLLKPKLDKNTRQEWEKSLTSREPPKMKQFLTFLQNRCQVLESIQIESNASVHKQDSNQILHKERQKHNYHSKNIFTVTQKINDYCNFCKGQHKIFNCEKFLKLSTNQRLEAVKREKLCFNCLRKNHSLENCKCSPCKKCNKKHNTLLHNDNYSSHQLPKPVNIQNSNDSQAPITNLSVQSNNPSQILLATAQVAFLDKNNKKQIARVVLDSGAQAHFITERFADLLQLKRNKTNIPVTSLNNMESKIEHVISTKLVSAHDNYETNVSLLVVPNITNALPSCQINKNLLNIPQNIKLADPTFYQTSEIDALIGAEIFYNCLCVGQIKIQNQEAVLQKTKFGWIVAGNINLPNTSQKIIACNFTLNSLNQNISKFWEIEEIPDTKFFTKEESEVEQHFLSNVNRNSDGRYVVKLPFNSKIHDLGSTNSIALKRFYTLERKLNQNEDLKTQYVNFINEYKCLNHMSEVKNDNACEGYFLPHHAVLKESSATTKVRVVFDGSAKSSSVADIEKMYRQILIHEDDQKYQKILWRDNPNDEIKTYKLNTVTYGTASASYLATRGLQKLAEDEGHNYPLAATVLKRDFYVDDLLTGSNNFNEAIKIRDEIIELLKSGGFNLRQWSSNNPKLIESLPNNITNLELFKDPTKSIKTLGMQWNSNHDLLLYSFTNDSNSNKRVTKRLILSKIAKLFDPIGLLGPIIVKAKLIMQRLWQEKIDWDESVPLEIHSAWKHFENQLPLLSDISFARQIIIENSINTQIHGFCDASESAYGACIYVRSVNDQGECITRLVCSKSKVAPLNSKITLPKLELCAALLLAKLYKAIKLALITSINEVHFWSDSTITLNWICAQPHALKTFVANRVSQIQSITNHFQWHHVPTKENPADFISRGQNTSEFSNNNLWKFGPQWLSKDTKKWPNLTIHKVPITEIRKNVVLNITLSDTSILKRFSSIIKLIRVIAYCLRFVNNSCKKQKLSGPLSTNEIQHSHDLIIKLIQNQCFAREIHDLTKNNAVSSKSSLKTLNAFLDENNIMRVGGRLEQSELPYNAKHPILLPKNNYITDLITRYEHEKALHAGVQCTLYQVRTRYWPIDGKNTIKRIIHSCIKCFRFRTNEHKHIMGNLPKNRLIESRPFSNTGIDYCGPFYTKEKKHRNRNKIKVYVAIFICFSTKAIHLELVSDLTTEAFLAALKRFFSRRGKSKNIYSDNATNFVGANNELKRLYELIQSENYNNTISNKLANEQINWHFIPPRSPHFGGLWESAVKSFKNHFLRTIGNTLLTFEELNTHIIEVEAILNSRPLTPLSSDPNDISALTPSHFLINDLLTSVPDVDFSKISSNRLSNWQHLQQLKQHFWTRWHKEYLNELNTRSKWNHHQTEKIQIGQLILLKEDNLQPLQWIIGRITAIHPGNDGIVRVVTVKTTSGEYKRSVKKISILPVNTD